VAALAEAAPRGPQPILVLASFDGWRWDYLDRGLTPNLRALADRGVRADRLIPVFPSKTFPNHYTIVTGLYPAHHGIVDNAMADPTFPDRFAMSATTARDARWWGGEPIWATAGRQGVHSATVFWPGSEAPIKGGMPTYWQPFDDTVTSDARVTKALQLLSLPEAERPGFVGIYFSETDHAGHDFGPDSPEVNLAIARLDDAAGKLVSGVRSLGLGDRTTLVFVSDHGMSALSDDRVIFLDDYIDLNTVDVVDWTPSLELNPRTGSAENVYRQLKNRHPALSIYRRADLPHRLHYGDNARIPAIVGLAADGWRVTSHTRADADRTAEKRHGGDHGYDPDLPSMGAMFVAVGPELRVGLRVPAFQNIHLYDFMCRVLGLKPAPNDGDQAATRGFMNVRSVPR
jgi:predicted AlkP superfamily pyrophosphatase or phosphodiesterase